MMVVAAASATMKMVGPPRRGAAKCSGGPWRRQVRDTPCLRGRPGDVAALKSPMSVLSWSQLQWSGLGAANKLRKSG